MRRTLLVVVAALITACAAGAEAPPEREADIVGVVTDITPSTAVTEGCVEAGDVDPDTPVSSADPPVCRTPGDVVGTVLVEAQPDADSGAKIAFTVTADTTVLEVVDGDTRNTAFAAVTPGVTVSAWADGPLAESFPMQGTAEAIVVEERP